MSRKIRFRQAMTAAALAAMATGAIALTAEPAFAIGPATVTKSGAVLTLTASPGTQDTIRIHEDLTTFSMRDETPQARKVRSIGRRCSKARPIAELTMKRPTRNDSIPNAVRLR